MDIKGDDGFHYFAATDEIGYLKEDGSIDNSEGPGLKAVKEIIQRNIFRVCVMACQKMNCFQNIIMY